MGVASSLILTYDATHETGRIEAKVKSIWLAIKLSKHPTVVNAHILTSSWGSWQPPK